jgi:hypothetical protein
MQGCLANLLLEANILATRKRFGLINFYFKIEAGILPILMGVVDPGNCRYFLKNIFKNTLEIIDQHDHSLRKCLQGQK